MAFGDDENLITREHSQITRAYNNSGNIKPRCISIIPIYIHLYPDYMLVSYLLINLCRIIEASTDRSLGHVRDVPLVF